jgi:antitoxin component YwqK of YwqJK toxin-antitoxin module
MPKKAQAAEEFIHYHKDGSIWAKGKRDGETPTGYWEWFRKDGTKLRSGYFENGEQAGEWTTYDAKGAVYKVTRMTPNKAKSKAAAKAK